MTSTTIWLAITICFACLAAMANGHFFSGQRLSGQQAVPRSVQQVIKGIAQEPDQHSLARAGKAANPEPVATATKNLPRARIKSGSGVEVVAGSDATRLQHYLADFEAGTTPELEERLASLESEVETGDYFRRANGGELDFAETMAFDDLLKRQEAIHLILLRRKLARLARLTAKL